MLRTASRRYRLQSRHAHDTHRNLTAASFGAHSRPGLLRWLVDRAPRRGPCRHGECEHGRRDPNRDGGAVDEASVQPRGVRGGDDGGHRAGASGIDSHRDIRRGERGSIRCSGRSLLRREHDRDRKHQREQHEHGSDDRHREDRPRAPLAGPRISHHRSPPTSERAARGAHRERPEHSADHRPASGSRDAGQLTPDLHPQHRARHESGCRGCRLPAGDTPRCGCRSLLQSDLLGRELHSAEAGRKHQKHGGHHRGELRCHTAALMAAVSGRALSPQRRAHDARAR